LIKKELKRIIAASLAIIICVSGVTGCNDQGSQQIDASTEVENSEIPEKPTEVSDPSISIAVDDNYRNYYEIFVGSYYDSDGDGIGDLNGITEKLDYIADLGCNGIWLTPMMAAPSYHKYDTTDYYLVDPSFGTNEDFECLAQECHDRKINIIIDLVINHSSSEHQWFKTATDYLRKLPVETEPNLDECPFVDYYHFSREQIDSTYREVSGSDWYYEAVFDYSQPDLNLANEELKAELKNVAKYWIDLGVDGFRMDAVMHYDEKSLEFNTAFLNEYYEYCKTLNSDFYMVSEVWSAEKTIADYYSSNTPSFFNFDVADAEGKLIKAGRGNLSAEKFVNACLDYQETYSAMKPDYIDAPFITNHDMGRVANAVMSDETTLKMAAGLLMTMQGSPFVYYGEEIGMKSKGKKDENKRLHMNWSTTQTEGICNDPQNADKDIEQSLPPVDEQLEDESSLLNFYKEALRIRNENPEIARGTLSVVEDLTADNIAVAKKEWNGSAVYIIYNTSDSDGEVDMKDNVALAGVLLAGDQYSVADIESTLLNGNTVHIPAKSIIFVR